MAHFVFFFKLDYSKKNYLFSENDNGDGDDVDNHTEPQVGGADENDDDDHGDDEFDRD